jgi:hypothetical protein
MPTKPAKKFIKRASIRYTPDDGTFAMIDVIDERPDGTFRPSMVALVPEESSKGVGLVLLDTPSMQVGSYCRVQVGKLPPMRAEVRWRREVEPKIICLGLLFLE